MRSILPPDLDAKRLAIAPAEIAAAGVPSLSITTHLSQINGFPYLDWNAVQAWVDSIPEPRAQALAWVECENAWLAHLRAALGAEYYLSAEGDAVVLSSLEGNVARATLNFMRKTRQRILRLLDDLARAPDRGRDILVVFDDDGAYYAYVAPYYPDAGEFARSGGMYIDSGCGHFATVKTDLHHIEPVIVHEMTHGYFSHLRIPTWLNEGLAVNAEQCLCHSPGPPLFTPQEVHAKHLRFWGESEIQQFWSGKSFLRTDDGSLLSYDLARIMVSQLSQDWSTFRSFVLDADLADAGAKSATEHLGIDLGVVACSLLEKEPAEGWVPNPAVWRAPPGRNAF